MAFGTYSAPGASTVAPSGFNVPQRVFPDFPAAASQIPGMVTPETTAALPIGGMNMGDLAAAYALQRRMKEDRAGDWARAAAINSARAAHDNASWNQGHYLPPTASQTSGMGYGQAPSNQGPVLWAPRNVQGPKLGTWASQQQNKAVAENREMPIVLQAHANDPYSPGEVGGGGAANVLGRGIFGPGLTSPMGVANPYGAAKSLLGGGGSVGRTKKGKAPNAFPEESLQARTQASGPQYQYDPLYRG